MGMHCVSGGKKSAPGSVTAVRAALESRADPCETNDDGVTPLILASSCGVVDVVRMLVEARADVSVVADEWGSALDVAIEDGHASVADYLVSVGAKQSGGDDNQSTERKVAASEKWGYDAFDGEKD